MTEEQRQELIDRWIQLVGNEYEYQPIPENLPIPDVQIPESLPATMAGSQGASPQTMDGGNVALPPGAGIGPQQGPDLPQSLPAASSPSWELPQALPASPSDTALPQSLGVQGGSLPSAAALPQVSQPGVLPVDLPQSLPAASAPSWELPQALPAPASNSPPALPPTGSSNPWVSDLPGVQASALPGNPTMPDSMAAPHVPETALPGIWPAQSPQVMLPQSMPVHDAGMYRLPEAAPLLPNGGMQAVLPASQQLPGPENTVEVLGRIASLLGGRGGQGAQPPMPPSGPAFHPGPGSGSFGWSGVSEGYATASPSMNTSGLAGIRGAGGWGYGTRDTPDPSFFLEPGRQDPRR